MSEFVKKSMDRRLFLGTTAAAAVGLASPALAQSGSTEFEVDPNETVRRNISSFRTLDWKDYFDNTNNGAILVDVTSRALHYWSADQSTYKLYPTSVPVSEDLTRLGRTKIA